MAYQHRNRKAATVRARIRSTTFTLPGKAIEKLAAAAAAAEEAKQARRRLTFLARLKGRTHTHTRRAYTVVVNN